MMTIISGATALTSARRRYYGSITEEKIPEYNGRTPQLFIDLKKPTNQLGNTVFALKQIYT
jgi:hypothetical protein